MTVDQYQSSDNLCRVFINILQLIKQQLSKDTRLIAVAHNGGKFDNIILIKFLFEKWAHQV
jgi:hypothetical protein